MALITAVIECDTREESVNTKDIEETLMALITAVIECGASDEPVNTSTVSECLNSITV
jgi:hypothetical protein